MKYITIPNLYGKMQSIKYCWICQKVPKSPENETFLDAMKGDLKTQKSVTLSYSNYACKTINLILKNKNNSLTLLHNIFHP